MRRLTTGWLALALLGPVGTGCSCVTDAGGLEVDGGGGDGGGGDADADADGDGDCTGNEVLCDDGCHDLSIDPTHCGDCERRCPEGATCESGQCFCDGEPCACPDGWTDCDPGLGVDCYNLRNDDLSCGECGHACDERQICIDRDCVDFEEVPGGDCDRCEDNCCHVRRGWVCIEQDCP